MKFIRLFEAFVNESIDYNEINDALGKCKLGTKIVLTKHDDVIRVVYYRGFRNGKHWGNYSPELKPFQNDFPIFPSKQVKIVKIGVNDVESVADFKDRIQTMRELDIEKKKEEKKKDYLDAYRHGKNFPNID